MTDICNLIQIKERANVYGDAIAEERSREVFCEVVSVGMREYYESQALGLRPEIKVILADYYDYNNEQIVELGGERYTVLRTYRTGNALELTLSRGVIADGST